MKPLLLIAFVVIAVGLTGCNKDQKDQKITAVFDPHTNDVTVSEHGTIFFVIRGGNSHADADMTESVSPSPAAKLFAFQIYTGIAEYDPNEARWESR